MQRKKGISLIVLVITIIVMIILAAAIIISLTNSGIINKANEAVEQTNLKQVQEIASLAWAEAYADGKTSEAELKAAVDNALTANKVDTSKYDVDVTESGVSVTIATGEIPEVLQKYILGGEKTGRIITEICGGNTFIFIDEETTIADASTLIICDGMLYSEDGKVLKMYFTYQNREYEMVVDMISGMTKSLGYRVYIADMPLTETWDHAYVCENGVWSEKITTQSEATGSIVANFYKINRQAEVFVPMVGMEYSVECSYKLVISGNGELGDTTEQIDGTEYGYAWLSGIYNGEVSVITHTSDIIVEEGITSIPESIFIFAHSAKNIEIPSTVTNIEKRAFAFTSANVNVSSDNSYYSSEEGILYDKNKTNIIFCPANKTNVTLPQTLTTVSQYAFEYCVKLSNITLPHTVTNIEPNSFANCMSLTELIIPENVVYLGDYMTSGCTLKTINILSTKLTTVGYYSLKGMADASTIYVQNDTIKSLITTDVYDSTKTTIEISE